MNKKQEVMTTDMNNKTDMLLDMIEYPERYTEEEAERLMADPECREIYTIMTEAKRGYAERKADDVSDDTIDTEWHRFESSHYSHPNRRIWHKYAAIITGVIMLSGITLAAIQIGRTYDDKNEDKTVATTIPQSTGTEAAKTVAGDSISIKPRQFENARLDEILTAVAAHYNIKVVFRNEDVKAMRLYFRWNPLDTADKVVESLNMFDKVKVSIADGELIVE